MEAEKALKLFDSFWFEQDILEKLSNLSFSSNSETNPDCENDVKASESEQVIFHTDSLSPNSVLSNSKLHSVFSETKDLEKARRRSRFERKSLPQLEDKELKGFMDMGFVFREEDRNSSLSLIIPGLNRLGKKDLEEEEIVNVDESKISRPYLSEAWEVIDLERRMKEKPLLLKNWKLPSCLGNEIDMKQNLRCWAHTVASIVR